MLLFHEEVDVMKLSDINRCCFRLIYDVLYIYLNMNFVVICQGFPMHLLIATFIQNCSLGPMAHMGDYS